MDNNNVKFLVDNMLGKSAKYLRMLGYDTRYPVPNNDIKILKIAADENRVIITRSHKLFKKATNQIRIILIESNQFQDNFRTIIKNSPITFSKDQLFQRCLECNTLLQMIDKSSIKDKIPPKVKKYCNKFTHCPNCQKIYWRGGHTERMLKKVRILFQRAQ